MQELDMSSIEDKYREVSTEDLKSIVVNKRHEAIEAAVALALRTDADDLIRFFQRYPLALSRNDESTLIREFHTRGIPHAVTAAAIESTSDAVRKRAKPKPVAAGSGDDDDPVIPDAANPEVTKDQPAANVIDGETVEQGPTYTAVMGILDAADELNAAIDRLLNGKPKLLAPAKKELKEVPGTARSEWTKQLKLIAQRMEKVGRMVLDV